MISPRGEGVVIRGKQGPVYGIDISGSHSRLYVNEMCTILGGGVTLAITCKVREKGLPLMVKQFTIVGRKHKERK